eukprot:jgi/Mesen1/6508/ME000332S05510
MISSVVTSVVAQASTLLTDTINSILSRASSGGGLFFLFIVTYLAWHFIHYGDNGTGPFIWPVVGCFPEMLANLDRILDYSVDMLKKQKTPTFRSFALGIDEIVTGDPKNLEYVLKTNFSNYPKGPDYQRNFRDLLGHGIFNSDDDIWRTQRKTASLEFSARSLRDLVVRSAREEVSQRLLPVMRKAAAGGTALDMQDIFLRFTFDNISRVGFGADPGCLDIDLPEVPFATAFDNATKATMLRNFLPLPILNLVTRFQLGAEKGLHQSCQVINEFTGSVITQRRAQLAAKKERQSQSAAGGTSVNSVQPKGTAQAALVAGDGHSDILSRFMLLQEVNGETYSDEFLRDACTNFILAGRDTSAVALSWFFWLLATHPHVETKIMWEINNILERRKADVGDEETFSFEELRSMTYLHAALSETLRLYPSVPADTKYAVADDVLPDGTVVKKGWRVSYIIYAMGRLESIWGPDAREFKPERWIAANGSYRNESPFKFPAFNAGPRLCLGRDMAYLTMKSVASSILRNFHLELVPGHKVDYQLSLTLFLKHGLLMTLRPRPKSA